MCFLIAVFYVEGFSLPTSYITTMVVDEMNCNRFVKNIKLTENAKAAQVINLIRMLSFVYMAYEQI